MENWNWRHGIPLFQMEMEGIKVVGVVVGS